MTFFQITIEFGWVRMNRIYAVSDSTSEFQFERIRDYLSFFSENETDSILFTATVSIELNQ